MVVPSHGAGSGRRADNDKDHPAPDETAQRLTALLLIEQRAVDPGTVPTPQSNGPGGASPARWLGPAAALAAGEPRRALALLNGLGPDAGPAPSRGHEEDPLARALEAAASAMDVNWQPGCSLVPLRPEALAAHRGVEESLTSLPDDRLRLCAHLAGQHIPVLLSARTTLGHVLRVAAAREQSARYGVLPPHGSDEDLPQARRAALHWFDELYEKVAASGHRDAAACHRLLAADLRVRAGHRPGAELLLDQSLRYATATASPATAGLAALLTGDWWLGAPGAAEQCTAVAEAPPRRALARAAHQYTQAESLYRQAGSRRGQAAALLRLAHVQRLNNDAAACRATVDRAHELAVAAGDGACVALLRVHRMLDGIAAGEDESGEGPEQVVHWAQTVGSASWLRGLRELVLQRSEFWSDQGEVVLSSRASQLARRLSPQEDGTASGGAAADNPAVTSETAPLLRARHRLSGIVLTDLELQDRLARLRNTSRQGREPGLADSLGVIQCAEVFHQQACALRDPDMMAASRSRIELAIGVGTKLTIAAEELHALLGMLRADLVSCTAQETFFRSRRARSAGLEQEAEQLARQALAQADSIPDEVLRAVLRCATLADLREGKAAEAEAQAVEPHLSAIQAAGLWLRLRHPDRAAEHARTIGRRGPDPDHPWELPAIRAELALARGAHDEAVHQAHQGLEAYQAHSVRLARDALRASFADDPVVAGLHHAAVLSSLARGGDSAAADSFAAAERGRVGFLGTVGARDAAGSDAAAQETVTNWLAAETRWSAEYEEQAAALRSETAKGPAAGPHSAPRQARIDEVGRALNTAEAEVRRKVPAALGASVTGSLPDAAAVAEALPPGVLLLSYHLYDDDLIGWAMTHGTLRAERLNCWQHRVVAAARRFRDWCATGGRRGAEQDGRWLSEVLLRPAAAQLANHHKVIVVPPASLSLLPFHALPWDGDVLAATHDVSYLPSATLLARNRNRPPDRPWAELSALLVGDPASDPSHGLAELPGTAAEAVEIARLLPRHRLLTGAAAHRGALLAAAPGCSVLHLATHGFVDELAPNRSRLKLAGHDFLGLADLLVAAHAPQLLMLSACDTGRGTATAGGDVLGLTRAALITGARHAVVSLWPVSDSTGCLVITRTYRQLVHAGTISVGTALARAQREVRELSGPERRQEFRALAEHAGVRPGPARRDRSWEAARDSEPLAQVHAEDRHPYHWAPFIHVGV